LEGQTVDVNQLQINKLRVLENLRSTDRNTGEEIYNYSKGKSPALDAKYTPVKDKVHFLNELTLIADEANEDDGILLFIESHGCQNGIEFSGELITWSEINEQLSEINEKSCMGLMVVFSCCYGVYFYKKTNILDKCPYYLMFGFNGSIAENKLFECNKLIFDGIINNQPTLSIESEVNLILPMTETKITILDAGDVFDNAIRHYLISSMDEEDLNRRAVKNYRELLVECSKLNVIPLDFNTIKKKMYETIFSKDYLETFYHKLRDDFLLTDKYLHLNCRFSSMLDDLYVELNVEDEHKNILRRLAEQGV